MPTKLVLRSFIISILILFAVSKVSANCTTNFIAAPVVDSITVDTAGNVTICWQTVVDPDLDHYAIYMFNPITGANDSIDEVNAPANCYTFPAGLNNSDIESLELSVVALDNCPTPNSNTSSYHNTIFLEHTIDKCAASVDLNWNAYDDFSSGTNVLYKVFLSVNAGVYTSVGSTLGTSFTYSGIVQGNNYNFFVRAYENNGVGPYSSSSNDVQINSVDFFKDPQFNYLYTATVVDSQQINLQFYVDTTADVSYYNVKRKTTLSEPYIIIATVGDYTGMNPLVTYTDYDVTAKSTHYYYEIETINVCGQLKYTSNIGKTIWLKAEADSVAEKNTLTITKYDGWLGMVDNYQIYRAVNGVWDNTPIATLAVFGDTTIYEDNIMNVTQGDGEFCYRVEAKERNIPHVGSLPYAISTSNESCVKHQPLIFVPNAFAPQSSFNATFKPILTFSDPDGYLFQVYNKWGQLVFETQDINEAWNGAFENSGKICPVDTYVYVIRFTSAKGKEFKKTGAVTMLR